MGFRFCFAFLQGVRGACVSSFPETEPLEPHLPSGVNSEVSSPTPLGFTPAAGPLGSAPHTACPAPDSRICPSWWAESSGAGNKAGQGDPGAVPTSPPLLLPAEPEPGNASHGGQVESRNTEITGRHQGSGPCLQDPEASGQTGTERGVSLKAPGSAAAPLWSGKASFKGLVLPLH